MDPGFELPGFDVPGFDPGFEVPGFDPGLEVPGFDGDDGIVPPFGFSLGIVPVFGLFGLVEGAGVVPPFGFDGFAGCVALPLGLVGFDPGAVEGAVDPVGGAVVLPVGGVPVFPVGGAEGDVWAPGLAPGAEPALPLEPEPPV
ncbi:MAG TPA: hypothetical protein VGZ91_04390 [Candidatus Sulfotelmatobacter sp.]|nr:hypothetical protein [Candidatus Sulfotelmatobacter sp.]